MAFALGRTVREAIALRGDGDREDRELDDDRARAERFPAERRDREHEDEVRRPPEKERHAPPRDEATGRERQQDRERERVRRVPDGEDRHRPYGIARAEQRERVGDTEAHEHERETDDAGLRALAARKDNGRREEVAGDRCHADREDDGRDGDPWNSRRGRADLVVRPEPASDPYGDGSNEDDRPERAENEAGNAPAHRG